MSYERVLLEFINRELLDGQGDDLDVDTPLLELGIIDSVSIVMLSVHISDELGVKIPPGDLIPTNLRDVRAIAKLIEALRRDSPGRRPDSSRGTP
jgi:acyl carrier protein